MDEYVINISESVGIVNSPFAKAPPCSCGVKYSHVGVLALLVLWMLIQTMGQYSTQELVRNVLLPT